MGKHIYNTYTLYYLECIKIYIYIHILCKSKTKIIKIWLKSGKIWLKSGKSIKKKIKIWLQNGKRTWIDISPKSYTNGQQTYKKMCSITNHQRNAKVTMRHYLTTIMMALKNKKQKTKNKQTKKPQKVASLVRMWKNLNSCALLLGL